MPPRESHPSSIVTKAPSSRVTWWCAGGLLGLSWGIASAQSGDDSAPKPTVSIVPRVSVTETFTDNSLLSSTGKRPELITHVSPGIRIVSQGGRVRGSLDYSLSEFLYANNTRGRQSQNALNTLGSIEVYDKAAYVDFSGLISQQSVSAFATQSNSPGARNANSTETSTYRLSPFVRGAFAGAVDYEARYSWTNTRSDAGGTSDVRTTAMLLRLSGRGTGALSWTVNGSVADNRYSLGRALAEDRIQGSLIYAFNPQLNLSLLAGREANNYKTLAKEAHTSAGLGLNWALSSSTKLAAQLERRAFGQSHSLTFEHRTPKTAWRFSDSRDVSAAPAQSGTTVAGSLGDLLFGQFASVEPDPLKRAQLVDQFLQTYGLRSDAKVISNFLASSATLQRRQEASFVLLGVRDTVSFVLSRASNSKLDAFATAFDDFTANTSVQQTGFTILYAHRLTQDMALSLAASRQTTTGSTALLSSSLRSIDLSLSGKLGRQINGSIGARRVFFDNATTPYSETSVTGNLSVQF